MGRYLDNIYKIFLSLVIILAIAACNRQAGSNSATTAQKPKQIRLVVGKIKEVRMPIPADTTMQLFASSENNEIVDVSKQSSEVTQTERPSKETFLIKGITPGTVKVILSRKKINEEGAGDIIQTYQVRVVNK
jgi:hypothetical protein